MDGSMKARRAGLALMALALLGAALSPARAQMTSARQPRDDGSVKTVGFLKRWSPRTCRVCPTPITEEMAPAPSSPAPSMPSEAAPPEPTPAPETDEALSSSLETASSPQSLAPNMLGDSIGSRTSSSFAVQSRSITRYKIGDNASPLPRGRILYNFNYYQDAFNTPIDVYRNLGGAEIPFFNNIFSVEIRGNLNTLAGTPGDNQTEGGNVVTTFKGIGYNNNDGFVVTGGLGIGWPVGPFPEGYPGGNTIFAPFLGYIYAPGGSNFFLQGFQQLDIPSASEDQLLLHTDIAGGYWLRRVNDDSFITGIAPTVEFHLYSPLGDAPSGSLAGVIYDDVLNATFGTTFVIANRASVAVGLGVPLSTRKDYDVEAQVQVNWFYGGGR